MDPADARAAVFETARLRMRPWTPDDAAAAFAIYGDPGVWRYLGDTPDPDADATRAGLRRLVAEYAATPGFGLWAVAERTTGEVLGAVGLRPLDGGPDVEVAYHVARRHWGRGIATEAATGALAYGFGVLGLARIVGLVHPANAASRRVLEKCGLTHERRGVWHGTVLDLLAIDAADWADRGTRR